MAENKLTARTLQKYHGKPQPKQATLADGAGLSARISPSGGVSWLFRFNWGDKGVWLSLGQYPELSLVDARLKRDQCRQWLAAGLDPRVELQLLQAAIEKPVTVGEALNRWISESGRANADKHRQQFNRWFPQKFQLLPLNRIGPDEVIACFTARQKECAATQKKYPAVAAGYVLANFKQAIKFCRSRRVGLKCDAELLDIDLDDVAGEKQNKRSRRLVSDSAEGGSVTIDYSQLADLLHYLDGEPTGMHWRYWRDLLLTCIYFGCRTQEIRLSRRREWDLERRLWTVPPEHNKSSTRDQKSGRDGTIVRPIPEALLPWLRDMLDGLAPDDYVLGSLKRPETVAMFGGSLHKKLGHSETWTLHDLRRTFATCVAGLGVAPHVVEALLGHSLGGVAAIYNRQRYLAEQLAALERWAEKVAELRGGAGESPTFGLHSESNDKSTR